MTPTKDPLAQLVGALLAGTSAGTVAWEQADSRGRAFIAKASEGTVTLAGSSSPGILGVGLDIKLAVKNAAGETIEEYETVPQRTLIPGSFVNNLDAELNALYGRVRERVTQAESTMTKLAAEFAPK